MSNRRFCRMIVAAICASCTLSIGCTTLEVYDRYEPVEGAEERDQPPAFKPYGVWIDHDTRWYSIGLFGAPVVPTKVKTGEPNTIAVSAWLDSNETRDFSFALAPCLQAADGRSICPFEAEIAAYARLPDPPAGTEAEARFRRTPPKARIANLVVALDAVAGDASRIDRERIYRHFMLDDAARWERFRVDVKYRYRCDGICPTRLSLEREGLIEVEGRTALRGRVVFERTRVRDYQPAAEVQ